MPKASIPDVGPIEAALVRGESIIPTLRFKRLGQARAMGRLRHRRRGTIIQETNIGR
jgi:hypothetical protein